MRHLLINYIKTLRGDSSRWPAASRLADQCLSNCANQEAVKIGVGSICGANPFHKRILKVLQNTSSVYLTNSSSGFSKQLIVAILQGVSGPGTSPRVPYSSNYGQNRPL